MLVGFASSPSPPFLDDLCTQPTAEPQPHPCRGENGPRVTGGSSPGKPAPGFCPVRSSYIREGFPSYPVTDEFIWELHLVGELTDPQQPVPVCCRHPSSSPSTPAGCTSHSWATTHGLSPPHRPTTSALRNAFYKCAQYRCYLWSSGGTLGLLKLEPVWLLGVLLVRALCLLPRAWEGFSAPFYSFHKYSCHFSSSPRWVLSSSGALTLSCPRARTQLCSWKMSPCSDSP